MNATKYEYNLSDEEFIDILDDIYGDVKICGMSYSSGRALLKLDQIAFNCARADYETTLDDQWECSECGEVYDNEDDAEECCTDTDDDEED